MATWCQRGAHRVTTEHAGPAAVDASPHLPPPLPLPTHGSIGGRAVASISCFFGVIGIAVPVAVIGTEFSRAYNEHFTRIDSMPPLLAFCALLMCSSCMCVCVCVCVCVCAVRLLPRRGKKSVCYACKHRSTAYGAAASSIPGRGTGKTAAPAPRSWAGRRALLARTSAG
jgi:hypothetical protein